MDWLTKLIDPNYSPSPPTELGKGQKPGEAAEGTVLRSIEAVVEQRVRSDPGISREDLYNTVNDFDSVRSTGRKICPLFLDECVRHYRLPQYGSSGGPSTSMSCEPDWHQPSSIALIDATDAIEIILPNDVVKPVVSTRRDGEKSYISQSIVNRCNLTVHGVSKSGDRKVFINLRWSIEVLGRGRSFCIQNCLFLVNDGLETDLAIGRRVQEQLENQAGSTEDNHDPENSSEDEASENGRQRPESQDAETSSHIGSSASSPNGNAIAKDWLGTFMRVMDFEVRSQAAMDTNADGTRQDHRNGSYLPTPESSERLWRRRRRESGDGGSQANRPWHGGTPLLHDSRKDSPEDDMAFSHSTNNDQKSRHHVPTFLDMVAVSQQSKSDSIIQTPNVTNAPTDPGYNGPSIRNDFALEMHSQHCQDAGDISTQFSNDSVLSTTTRDRFIAEFVETLLHRVRDLQQYQDMRETLVQVFPDLLKAFYLRVGHNATTQMHRDIMAFLQKYRDKITDEFERSFPEPAIRVDPAMKSAGRIDMWQARISAHDDQYDPTQHSDQIHEGLHDAQGIGFHERTQQAAFDVPRIGGPIASQDREEDNPQPLISSYQAEILKMPAYEWLLQRLGREMKLYTSEPNVSSRLRQGIIESLNRSLLPKLEVHPGEPPPVFVVVIDIDWDLEGFLQQQEYDCQLSEALLAVVTLTGSPSGALATTSRQYMIQTWPCTGQITLKLIQDVLNYEIGHQCHELRASRDVQNPERLRTVITGIETSIAEVVEQIAWLGSALRSSTQDNGLQSCVPEIKPQSDGRTLSYMMSFTSSEMKTAKGSDGQCWHDLFKNPVLVSGFPIPRRDESDTGVEMPLDLIAALSGTNKIDYCDQIPFIKGFSTLLTPQYYKEDILIWHLSVRESEDCIPYPTASDLRDLGINHNDLRTLRHVVGWCASARFFAGSQNATYLVKRSFFPKLPEDFAAANASISTGVSIPCSSGFILGAKDQTIHCEAKSYMTKLNWILDKIVLLWDEEDKRGWLVNGASALLHLVRANLAYENIDQYKKEFLRFQQEDIPEADPPLEANSAYRVLACTENHKIGLYEQPESDTLKDRILYYYDILAKALSLQAGFVRDQTGPRLNLSVEQATECLVAWDFVVLAKDAGPFSPKLAKIQAVNLEWLEVVKEHRGVTLVGRGFGDIIKPAHEPFCERWSELPAGKHYIAASISDIKRIVDKYPDEEYVQFTPSLNWYNTGETVVSCKFTAEENHSACVSPVQLLLPPGSSFPLPVTQLELRSFGRNGAIIFGQQRKPEQKDMNSSSDAESDRKRKANGNGVHQTGRQSCSQSLDPRTLNHDDYRVAIICPMEIEMSAVRYMLDEEIEELYMGRYTLGKLQGHCVVLTWFSSNRQGKSAAAAVATDLRLTFGNIKSCFLVGIGGGNPCVKDAEIRLGDVVVSEPGQNHPGVVQYDLGKHTSEGYVLKGVLPFRPSEEVCRALVKMKSNHRDQEGNKIDEFVEELITRCEGLATYNRPKPETDISFDCSYRHESGRGTCELCSRTKTTQRSSLSRNRSKIHFGLIASGDSVIKTAKERDLIANRLGGDVLCFEMEAAGVLEVLPCTVIRGISDYADSNKNDVWHCYAAAAAAAFTKVLLTHLRPAESQRQKRKGFEECLPIKRQRNMV